MTHWHFISIIFAATLLVMSNATAQEVQGDGVKPIASDTQSGSTEPVRVTFNF